MTFRSLPKSHLPLVSASASRQKVCKSLLQAEAVRPRVLQVLVGRVKVASNVAQVVNAVQVASVAPEVSAVHREPEAHRAR